jgi:hypothetical protein
MKTTITIVLIGFLGFFSCNPHSELNESDKVTITYQVNTMLQNYYKDIATYGLKAEFKYLDSSKDFFWVPPGYSLPISYDSVATILRQNAPMFVSIDNSFDSLRIIPLSLNLATYSGRLKSKMIDTTGKAINFSLVETGVIIKRADGWKLLHGQTSILNQ